MPENLSALLMTHFQLELMPMHAVLTFLEVENDVPTNQSKMFEWDYDYAS